MKIKKKKLRRLENSILIAAICVVAIGLAFSFRLWFPKDEAVVSEPTPVAQEEQKPASEYPVNGIDISAHQGDIDWPAVADEGVDFAYMKATEGKDFTDKKFVQNWTNANKTDIKVGAYHFLSYENSGQEQAQHFINTVPKVEGSLPPMIDIEFDMLTVLPDDEVTIDIIGDMITELESYYGVKPVLYVTYDSYTRFIQGNFDDYPIWIVDVNKPVDMPDDSEWMFWQYSQTSRLSGINQGKSNVDFDVYNGTAKEFSEIDTVEK